MSLGSSVQTPPLSLSEWRRRRRIHRRLQQGKTFEEQRKRETRLPQRDSRRTSFPIKYEVDQDKDKYGYISQGEMNKLAKNLTKDQIDKVIVEYKLKIYLDMIFK